VNFQESAGFRQTWDSPGFNPDYRNRTGADLTPISPKFPETLAAGHPHENAYRINAAFPVDGAQVRRKINSNGVMEEPKCN